MTCDEWFEKYKPIKNHLDNNACYGGTMFETYGREREFIRSQPDNRIWTLIDPGCTGRFCICSGFRFIDRMGYFVTEIPWTGDEEIALGEAEDDEIPVDETED